MTCIMDVVAIVVVTDLQMEGIMNCDASRLIVYVNWDSLPKKRTRSSKIDLRYRYG